MTATTELRYADAKEIAAEARRILRATFPGVKFSVRSADNTVAVVYNAPVPAEREVRDAIWHLRAYENPDEWGALKRHDITLASGETLKGLHSLIVRNDHRENQAVESDEWNCGSGYCDPNTGCPACSDEDRPWVKRS